MKYYLLLFVLFAVVHAQHKLLLSINEEEAPFALIKIEALGFQTYTDSSGVFLLPSDTLQVLEIFYLGNVIEHQLRVTDFSKGKIEIKAPEILEEMVVSATRTSKFNKNNAIKVNAISAEDINRSQACNLAEGLKFQPGLRVESDCQTCNYTQIRMNGLPGAYTQILMNGRPVFSPLLGLYGLEQIPQNMISKIEIVNGGGSVLYGSAAIGGTINIMTDLPQKSEGSLQYNYQNVAGNSDHQVFSNQSFRSKDKKWAGFLFANYRNRDAIDLNKDDFSEFPELQNIGSGLMIAYMPKVNHKIELSASYLNEERFGGDMQKSFGSEVQWAAQAEERLHNVLMTTLDYQVNINNQWSNIFYIALQHTDRQHFTGVQPDDSLELQNYLTEPPYGTSFSTTLQIGNQINFKTEKFFKSDQVFTLGVETQWDKAEDIITAYRYGIKQNINASAIYLQSDWDLSKKVNLLSGIRLNQNTLLSNLIWTPRIALLIKMNEYWRWRNSWAQGYRAPQAFDTDTHIAFAGGGISRVFLAKDIKEERSNTFLTGISFDRGSAKFRGGFGLDVFYTQLQGSFVNVNIGQDSFGLLFEKQNARNALVYGLNLSARFKWSKILETDAGLTLQKNEYSKAITYISGVPGEKSFLKAPESYAYFKIFVNAIKNTELILNYNYTGPMKVLHLAGAPEQGLDELIVSKAFNELDFKVNYTFNLKQHQLQCFSGVKNIFNSFQKQFDTTKNRDSNYIYGPMQPRTIYIGVKWEWK